MTEKMKEILIKSFNRRTNSIKFIKELEDNKIERNEIITFFIEELLKKNRTEYEKKLLKNLLSINYLDYDVFVDVLYEKVKKNEEIFEKEKNERKYLISEYLIDYLNDKLEMKKRKRVDEEGSNESKKEMNSNQNIFNENLKENDIKEEIFIFQNDIKDEKNKNQNLMIIEETETENEKKKNEIKTIIKMIILIIIEINYENNNEKKEIKIKIENFLKKEKIKINLKIIKEEEEELYSDYNKYKEEFLNKYFNNTILDEIKVKEGKEIIEKSKEINEGIFLISLKRRNYNFE
jgi:hypothetical protein